jgi:2-oxoisovalerate dehydrogenase E2 component (dihydrolipoyl transacylase)
VFTTPASRGLIHLHGLDINKVPASGKKGRILKEDVLEYIASGQAEKDKQS